MIRTCGTPPQDNRAIIGSSDRSTISGVALVTGRVWPYIGMAGATRYQVVLVNDDCPPMEFVVDVLEHIFGLDRTTATRVMLEVHTRGKGVCGVFTYEIAETKVAQVTTYARQHQHPLLCTMEEA